MEYFAIDFETAVGYHNGACSVGASCTNERRLKAVSAQNTLVLECWRNNHGQNRKNRKIFI